MTYKTIPSLGRRGFKPLIDYTTQDEKLLWSMFGNLLSERTAAIEMEAVAAMNSRVKDPAYHVVISLSPEDQPTQEQIEDLVRATLHELRATEHQFVATQHIDAQPHVHLVINRVHPVTYKTFDTAFDWWRLDALAAKLEAYHGFRMTMHGRATTLVEVDGVEWKFRDLLPARPAPGARRSLAWEGRLSYQEWLAGPVRSDALTVINRPGATWAGFHRALAKHGVRYELYGRGATVVDATDDRFHARAAHIARFATLPKLEERLGPYEPPPRALKIDIAKSYAKTVAHAPPDRGPAELWESYQAHLGTHKEQRSLSRAQRWKEQRERDAFRRGLIREDAKDRLKDLRTKKGLKIPRKVLRAQLRAQEKQRLAALNAKIRKEHIRLRKELNAQPRPLSYRYFLRNLASKGDVAAMEYLSSIQARQRVALTLPSIDAGFDIKIKKPGGAFVLPKPEQLPLAATAIQTPKPRTGGKGGAMRFDL